MKCISPESVGMSSEKLKQIETMCNSFIDKGQIAGAQAIISRKNRIIYNKSFAYPENSIYRVFSMSKPITAAAALILYDEGLYSLDEPIKKYIPAFKNPKIFLDYSNGELTTKEANNDITIGQLFTMTSGLSYGFGDKGLDKYYNDQFELGKKNSKEEPTLEMIINQIASFPLLFEPGEDFNYSFSIDVIGRLIEVISGQKYSEFISERLLNPLGMVDTHLFTPEDKESRLATLFQWNGEKLIEREDLDPNFEMPGGGYRSTAEDYIKFCQFLLNKGEWNGKQILGKKTVEWMSSNHLTGKALETFTNNFKKGYGYGLGVRSMINPQAAGLNGSVGEWGWDGMASTWMCIDPKEELTAVFMIQLLPYNCFPAQTRFQQIMYSAIKE